MNGMIKSFTIPYILFFIVIYSLLLSPQIKIETYNVYVFDILLPIISIFVVYQLIFNLSFIKYILDIKNTPLLLFSIYFFIFISSLLVNQSFEFVNITETYKFIRFIFFFIFFIIILSNKLVFNKLHIHANIIFILLVIFNLFNYFNLFQFNNIIEPYYSWGKHLFLFGVNSKGEPDTKRLIGTLGNPNLNAIIFSFFYVYYLIESLNKKKALSLIYSILALTLMLLCQSRTSIIATVFVLIILFILNKNNYLYFFKIILLNITITAALIFSIQIIDNNYSTIKYVKQTSTSNNSVTIRIEIWKFLLYRLKDKPLLGYGPDKIFLREHQIYPESEYIYVAYKYGIVGLIIFLLFYFWPLYTLSKPILSNTKIIAMSYFLICYIASITNFSFEDFQLNVFYSLILAIYCLK